jgi:hypothetical protein
MRPLALLSLLTAGVCLFFSCAKWKDPAPVKDPRLTNPYCNEPSAVNYNWGFPGRPDNTVCFYPSDLFQGNYLFFDSVYLSPSGLFVGADSFIITITKLSNSKIGVKGFCSSGSQLRLTAGPTYVATVDTTLGDTTSLNLGQALCRIQDTVSGTISRDRVDSTLLHIALQVVSDTGISVFIGKARKQ